MGILKSQAGGIDWINPGYNYVIVQAGSDATVNGNNLLAAYVTAKALTPGGNPLSATNRACVLLLPGAYEVADGALIANTSFVDIIGIVDDPEQNVITSNGNTLTYPLAAINVAIINITLESTWAGTLNNDDTDKAPLFFESISIISAINCVFRANISDQYPCMRTNTIIATGSSFKNCVGGVKCFGSGSGSDCQANCENCIADTKSFGGAAGTAIASGTFTNCISTGDSSFGGNTTGSDASGIFIDCRGLDSCFGADKASGTFTNCTAGSSSFGGGGGGGATGVFTNCIAGNSSFSGAGVDTSGTFINCVGGNNCFGGNSGGVSGIFINCTSGNSSFGTSNTVTGIFDNISMPENWDCIFSGTLKNSTIKPVTGNADGITDVRTGAVIDNCRISGVGSGISLNTTQTGQTIKAIYSAFNTAWSAEITNDIIPNNNLFNSNLPL